MYQCFSTYTINSYFSKVCFIILTITVFTIIGLGIYALHTSPYTGLRLAIDNDKWIVNRKDINTPFTLSDLFVGDRIDEIFNIIVDKSDFIRFPEFFRKKEERKWWEKQKTFFELLQNNNSINFGITRKASQQTRVKANIQSNMPLLQVVKRTILIYISSVFFIGIGGISLIRRPSSTLNVLCAFFSGFGALYLASVAPIANRDLSLLPSFFHIFLIGSFIGAGGLITLVHFSLIYPRQKLIVASHPKIICVLYIYFFLTVTLYLSGLSAFGAFFPFLLIWTLIMMFAYFHSWIKEKDVLLKKQISVSLITPVASGFVFVFINLLPTFLGLPPLDFNYFALIALILPFTLFFVIENYYIYVEKTISEQENQKERQNIIEELHDNIGNDLTNITMFSEVIAKYLTSDIKKTGEYVTYIKETSKKSMEHLRDFLYTFDTKHVTWDDLINHFKEYGSILLQSKEINLNFQYSMNGNISNPRSSLKFDIYRIYKEAIVNILKHSKAENVDITIIICEKEIKIEIKDDGIGFDIVQKSNEEHYGIRNMKKRTQTMNGTFNIDTRRDGGAVIGLDIPIG